MFRRGAIQKLDESELEGILGHEIAHLVNQDSPLQARLVAMLFGLSAIVVVAGLGVAAGLEFLRQGGSGRSSRDEAPVRWLGIFLTLLWFFVGLAGGLGWFAGRLLAAAVSRQREFLADSGAAQITGDARGILGALRKIGAESGDAASRSQVAGVCQHILFSGLSRSGWLDSHPPIAERIALLERRLIEARNQ